MGRRTHRRRWRAPLRLAAPILTLLLAACSLTPLAPAGSAPEPASEAALTPLRGGVATAQRPEPRTGVYVVQPGDTLYSIAWEAGRDYHDLASWNGIGSNYLIIPGQEIRLTPPAVAARATAKPAPKPRRDTTRRPSGTPLARSAPVTGGWTWPTGGSIVGRFGDSAGNKGLDIGGTAGQAIQAAAAGRVVYSGSGLRGYGRLIIIKHSEEYLSAYAHNDRIDVKEGDVVKRGQKIAEMGSSGTDRVKLHFEIRRHGTPVDPLTYLPKK